MPILTTSIQHLIESTRKGSRCGKWIKDKVNLNKKDQVKPGKPIASSITDARDTGFLLANDWN